MSRLVVLSGPSGVGKGSVVAALRALRPDIWISVSVTTRAPRPGEVDGREYHFVDRATFEAMVARGELLEHASYAGNLYGTPRAPVEERLARGEPMLLEIELQGARQVRAALGERAFLVFLAPPSWQELRRRLIGRGTEDDERVARRLAVAREELAARPEFDATVVNDDIGNAVAALLPLLESRRS
jgi:guanylate kinase